MKMANIMNYKLILYVFNVMLCFFSLSGINFNSLFKTNKVVESRIFVMILGFILAYLLTNFILDFLSISTTI